MDLKFLFQRQQRLLELELEIARERFKHYGLRGNAVEIAVRNFLENHLPRSLTAGTGEVVALHGDTHDRTSGQIDIVVSNAQQPFMGPRDTPTTFFIEGVHVAGEVKTSLNRSILQGEFTKARRFRALRARNLSRLVAVPKPDNWLSYYVFYRPYFLLGLETPANWRVILLELMEYIEKHRAIPLDGIFMLDQDVVILVSPYLDYPMSKQTGIPFKHFIDGKETLGSIHIFNTDAPLAFFMAWIASFRSSFFDDENPLAFYLQDVLSSVPPKEITISESIANTEGFIKLAEEGDALKALIEALRLDFPIRSETEPRT
ncbi:hypothetical protein A8A54_04505 [Brucella pseudogrignonensis]|uniref:DUF6602 domain-containing protein n=1 Tax=Brucella pseudogrignonensis TaxID=419475 RepID=UPI0007DA7561|nr:DUF6602 domain-containing protein [Brucella pseudogrignonensis]ANG95812.1 hypothetical protein A8A54_04505 [Brucella pseudogrignonensis]